MSQTQKNATANATSPSKSTKGNKAKKILDNANAAKAATVVVAQRESKYLYPATAKTAGDKKSFRRTARATEKRYQKDIAALAASNEHGSKKALHAMQEEHNTWKSETYAAEA